MSHAWPHFPDGYSYRTRQALAFICLHGGSCGAVRWLLLIGALRLVRASHEKNLLLSWVFWALLSADLVALISHLSQDRYRECQFGLCDVYSHPCSDLVVAGMIVYASGIVKPPPSVSATWLFSFYRRAATGAS